MNTKKDLEALGFKGFIAVKDLQNDTSAIPRTNGVYAVVRLCKSQPTFLKKGTGGFFKDRNPNVDILTLEEKWVDRTEILYIGKAGGGTSSSTLYKRIKQYLDFGNGKKVGHWGGRYIWQLQDSDDLYFCWKETQTGNLPREEETSLITIFKESHEGKLPFANLTE